MAIAGSQPGVSGLRSKAISAHDHTEVAALTHTGRHTEKPHESNARASQAAELDMRCPQDPAIALILNSRCLPDELQIALPALT